jgi:signal transduction histidine kinase
VAVAALAGLIAAVTSRAEDWQPAELVITLGAFCVANELLSYVRVVPGHAPWVINSSAPYVLAMALLGPAPAVVFGAIGLAADTVVRRVSAPRLCLNLANYGTFLVVGGLVSRQLIETWQLSPDTFGFALLILGVYLYTEVASILLNALGGKLYYGESFRGQLRQERDRQAWSAQWPSAVLTAITGYAYGRLGLEALGLLAVAQLTFQYFAYNLLLSQDRAEALRRRAAQLTFLHGALLQAEENERRRLAAVLHDDALQNLLFAHHTLAPIAAANGARRAVGEAIDQLHGAIYDLHPAVLEHAGLEPALQEVAARHAKQAGFQAEVRVDPGACGPHDSLLFVLGREQLTNVAKHAGASRVVLHVTSDDGMVVMEVADDGRGMDPGRRVTALEQGHIGLASSAERVEALGGTLEIQSAPGRGTRIRTALPVRR